MKLIDLAQTPSNYYLIYDNCHDFFLKNYLKDKGFLSEFEAAHYLRQIIMGLELYREKGFPPRDINIKNIMKHGKTVRIDDFGFEKFFSYIEQKL